MKKKPPLLVLAVGTTGACPEGISIPDFFEMYNAYHRDPGEDWKIRLIYLSTASNHAKASDCIQCGQCESHCPQQLAIISHLKQVADTFE